MNREYDCDHMEELLSPYLENELDAQQKQAVHAHLQVCPDCSQLLADMQETCEALANFPELDLSQEFIEQLQIMPQKRKRFRLSFDFFLRPSLQPVLAAVTIFLTLLSFYLFHPQRSQFNKSVNRQLHMGYSKIERLYAKAESFTSSLAGHKDSILVSLKSLDLLGRDED
jgi:predicted anti-sigma-YlaC factor YlaD